jgi:hypothetical protein
VNPQHEAHERMCKSIGDMAKENDALKQRIRRLEEALQATTNWIVQLADSGDAGSWDPEVIPEMRAARAALENKEVTS